MHFLSRYLAKRWQKITFALMLSVIFLMITAVTRSTVRQAGGLACFFIAAILVLAVLKLLFFEFVTDEELRRKGRRAFEFCHTCFGWITFVLIVYHSLFFISLAFWPENKISANYYVTGALALVPLSLVITSGLDKNILGGKAKEPSKINVTENEKEPLKIKEPKFVYVNHIVMTILLAVLILVHINFQ
jgi:hypothetical protein